MEFYFNKLKSKTDLTPEIRNQLAKELVQHAQENVQPAIDSYKERQPEEKFLRSKSKKPNLLKRLFGGKDEKKEDKKASEKQSKAPPDAASASSSPADAVRSQIAILHKQVITRDKYLRDTYAALSLQTPELVDNDVYLDFARFVNSVGEGKVEVLVDGQPLFESKLNDNTYMTATTKAALMLQEMMKGLGYQSREASDVMAIFRDLVQTRDGGQTTDAVNTPAAVFQPFYYCLKDSSGTLTRPERPNTPASKNIDHFEGKMRETSKADQERYERLKAAMQRLPDRGAGLFHMINFVVNQRPLTSASSVPAKALETYAAETRQAVAKKAFDFPEEGLKRVANFFFRWQMHHVLLLGSQTQSRACFRRFHPQGKFGRQHCTRWKSRDRQLHSEHCIRSTTFSSGRGGLGKARIYFVASLEIACVRN